MRKFPMPTLNTDARGIFWQIAQDGWGEINYVETHADQYRGKHFHKENYELFFIISGQVEVTMRSLKEPQAKTILASKGEAILIEPYELHTFYTRVDTQWMVLLSKGINSVKPDFYQVEEFERLLKRPLPKIKTPMVALSYV
jgi:dTDP-4-dehydrorhamnose 3,5-epimerase-like enzyme